MLISADLVYKRLRLAREFSDRSRRYVAGKLGISAKRLCAIENGRGMLTLELFLELCKVLEVTEMEILTGIDKQGKAEYQLTFEEIVENCSEETVEDILNICKRIAQIETRNQKKKQNKMA